MTGNASPRTRSPQDAVRLFYFPCGAPQKVTGAPSQDWGLQSAEDAPLTAWPAGRGVHDGVIQQIYDDLPQASGGNLPVLLVYCRP